MNLITAIAKSHFLSSELLDNLNLQLIGSSFASFGVNLHQLAISLAWSAKKALATPILGAWEIAFLYYADYLAWHTRLLMIFKRSTEVLHLALTPYTLFLRLFEKIRYWVPSVEGVELNRSEFVLLEEKSKKTRHYWLHILKPHI